jgi:hypothetical protein
MMSTAAQPRSRVEHDETHSSAISAPSPRGGVASFGPFRLHVTERLLEKNGVPVKLGSRALDILVTLLEHAPEVVSKHDLTRRAWGRLIVDEGSIRANDSMTGTPLSATLPTSLAVATALLAQWPGRCPRRPPERHPWLLRSCLGGPC